MTEFVTLATTTDERAVADAIAAAVIDRGLAACARIGAAESVYRWKGETCRTQEFTIEIKTLATLAPAVEDAVRSLHNYDLPEILVLPILGGSDAYLSWLRAECCGEERQGEGPAPKI